MIRPRRWLRLSALAAALTASSTLTTPAWAAPPGSRMTREFVQASAQIDTFEIAEAQLALTTSTDPKVRAFAEMMIRDHEQTRRALAEAAARAGLEPPPAAMNGDQARLLGTLQSLAGAAFDQAYIDQQALGHRSALTVEQTYAANGDTPAIKRVAAATAAIVEAHLRMAEELRAR